MGPPVVNAYFASQEHKNAYGPRCKTHILLPKNTKILTSPVVKRIFCFPCLCPPFKTTKSCPQGTKKAFVPRSKPPNPAPKVPKNLCPPFKTTKSCPQGTKN